MEVDYRNNNDEHEIVDFGYKVNNPYKYLEPYSQFNKLYEIIL